MYVNYISNPIVLPKFEDRALNESSFSILPEEIFIHIFEKMDYRSVFCSGLTCRKFQRIANDPTFSVWFDRLKNIATFCYKFNHNDFSYDGYGIAVEKGITFISCGRCRHPNSKLPAKLKISQKEYELYEKNVLVLYPDKLVFVDHKMAKKIGGKLLKNLELYDDDIRCLTDNRLRFFLLNQNEATFDYLEKAIPAYSGRVWGFEREIYIAKEKLSLNLIHRDPAGNEDNSAITWVETDQDKIYVLLGSGYLYIWDQNKLSNVNENKSKYKTVDVYPYPKMAFETIKGTEFEVIKRPECLIEKSMMLSPTGVRAAKLFTSLDFNKTKYLFLLDGEGILFLFDWTQKKLLKKFPETKGATSIAITPDYKVALGRDGRVDILDFRSISIKHMMQKLMTAKGNLTKINHLLDYYFPLPMKFEPNPFAKTIPIAFSINSMASLILTGKNFAYSSDGLCRFFNPPLNFTH